MPIRHATPDDAPAIARIHVTSWQAAYRGQLPDELLDGLTTERREAHWREAASWPSHTLLVADDDAGVVGFVSCAATQDLDGDPAATGEVRAIYVDPAAYGRGYGRSLMDRAVEELERRGFRNATLWVLASNDRARRFYEREGWEADGATKVDEFGTVEMREVRYARRLGGRPDS